MVHHVASSHPYLILQCEQNAYPRFYFALLPHRSLFYVQDSLVTRDYESQKLRTRDIPPEVKSF